MKAKTMNHGSHQGKGRRHAGIADPAASIELQVKSRTTVLEAELDRYRRTERRLLEMQAHLANAQEIASIGSWDWDLASDQVTGSLEFHRMYGTEASPVSFKEFLECMHPEDREGMKFAVETSCRTLEPFSYYHRIVRPDGTTRMLHGRGRVLAEPGGRPAHVAGTDQDVTERVEFEKKLKLQAEELERTNAELRQFAYVASHDLQEPLRTVASFTRLLQKRYGGRLDAEADEIINFAVEGAKHMQALIEALLIYFRVDRQELKLKGVDSAKIFDQAVADLNAKISETGARVTRSALPMVTADQALLAALFQNLIDNAIKYRSKRPARVRVSASMVDGLWKFVFNDNGIGIDPRHHERIFLIFQRLHTRQEAPGTGIGLSICKKIVERHGGRMWVESASGKGAKFCFTVHNGAHAPQPAPMRI